MVIATVLIATTMLDITIGAGYKNDAQTIGALKTRRNPRPLLCKDSNAMPHPNVGTIETGNIHSRSFGRGRSHNQANEMMRLTSIIVKPVLLNSDLLDAIKKTIIKNGPRTEYKISPRRRKFDGDSSKSE